MTNSYLIWIPSIQQYLRFRELNIEQYKCILKTMDIADLEFIHTLNEIIQENIVSKFEINKFTTLDRFVIFITLKIYSCGSVLTLAKKCEKCEKTTNVKMDLNVLLDNIAPKIDQNFLTTVKYENYTAICNIPQLDSEYQIYSFNNSYNKELNNIEYNLNNYTLTHIQEILVNNTSIGFSGLSYTDKNQVLHLLPGGLTANVQKGFIKKIHKIVEDIDFLKISCQGCTNKFEINFNISNINEILKVLYKDNSLESVLQMVFNVSSVAHLQCDPKWTPAELEIHYNFAKEVNKSDEPSDPTQKKQTDLFEEMKSSTAHMQESPSEFS